MALLLKREYHRDKNHAVMGHDGKPYVAGVNNPSVSGIIVKHTGAAGSRHHFSPELIAKGAAEGWLSLAQGKITIHGADGDVAYRIVREPGGYCAFCDAPVPLNPSAPNLEAQAHVKLHGGKPSPDPQNPAGYRGEAYYTGILLDGKKDLTREQAAVLDLKHRQAFHAQVREKYGAVAARKPAKKAKGG